MAPGRVARARSVRRRSILGYRFCDTGLLYRAVTWLALDRGVDLADATGLEALVPEVVLAADAKGRMTRVQVEGTT